MKGPDGTIYPNRGEIKQLEPPRLLSFNLDVVDQENRIIISTLNTVQFTDLEGRTRVSVHAQALGHAAEAGPHMAGMEAGWGQTIDRFSDYIRKAKERT